MLLLQSVIRWGSALVVVLALPGCNDDLPTAPVVPIPATPGELSGAWSLSDSSVITTPIEETACRYRGVVTFTAGIDETAADLRMVGTCISPRGPATSTALMEGDRVTVTGDSIAFTVISGSGTQRESCRYLGRLTGGSSLGASGSVSCLRGRTGTWQLSWGQSEPVQMGKLATIEIGLGQTCALELSGRAFCWGANSIGNLGTGDDLPRLVPAPVAGDLRFTQIAVATYGSHACGVTVAGQAYCWGSSWSGQLGDGSGAEQGTAVMLPQPVVGGHAIKQISAGGGHTCAITTSGAAYCWGSNGYGQLGTGNETPSSTPVAVAGGLTFRQIAAYDLNTCGVTTDGAAYCWGEGSTGVLGNGGMTGSNVPSLVSGGLTFASVSVGLWMACGVTTLGDGYCWGEDFGTGNLGTGSAEERRTTPALVTGGMKWKSIRAGGFVACGVAVTNVGYCWGQGDQGALGAGSANAKNTNRPIPIAGGLALDQVMSDYHGCALTIEGLAYCWSSGRYGQIGDGSLRFWWEPVRVAGQS